VGAGATAIVEGAIEAGLGEERATVVADRDEALGRLVSELRAGDTVLVKASRGAALDLLVDQLLRAAAPGADRA
jgi:UDP-N-acetylmuramoyl-tripeptide--D-alanyl-D-alanine ligase